MPQTKVCRDCGKRRPIDRFYSNRARGKAAGSLRPECKTCTAARRAAAAAELETLAEGTPGRRRKP